MSANSLTLRVIKSKLTKGKPLTNKEGQFLLRNIVELQSEIRDLSKESMYGETLEDSSNYYLGKNPSISYYGDD